MSNIHAGIILIGNELLDGRVQDTHGKYLCDLLNARGITIDSVILIPDDEGITECLVSTASRSNLLIVAGGLGPTSDDLTREAVAQAAGVDLVFCSDVADNLKHRFRGKMAESNLKQAYIPGGFQILENPTGTAPGFYGEIGACFIAALPGPPSELRSMVDLHLDRLLKTRFSLSSPEHTRISTFLIAESRIEDILEKTVQPGVRWGTRAEPYRILVELRGGSESARDESSRRMVDVLGPILGVSGDHLPNKMMLELLTASNLTIAAAESCTGGLVGKLLTDLPGSSDAVWGSMTTYANEAKEKVLSVPNSVLMEAGAVSRETVLSMCAGVLELSHADVAVAVSGVAGPGGGTPEKPVGTVWIGANFRGRTASHLFSFTGSRDLIRRRSAAAALLMAFGIVKGIDVDNCETWEYI